MKNIGLIVNSQKPQAPEAVRRLAELAAGSGITLHAEAWVSRIAPGIVPCDESALQGRVEGVIVLGGDGTLLNAAHRLTGTGLPLIGFNIGTLGYLTTVNEDGFGVTLRALARDAFRIEQRATLSTAILRRGEPIRTLLNALNDVVVTRGATGRALTLELFLNETFLCRYVCDGLVIATPTGSTAYSLSAGGPILLPDTRACVISAISPHALTARPLVIPDHTAVTIRLLSVDIPWMAFSDGQEDVRLDPEDSVRITLSDRQVPLIIPEGSDPLSALSRKLGWGRRNG